MTDRRPLTDANAAPATDTALVKTKNESTNMNASNAPKASVVIENFVLGVANQRIRQTRDAMK